MALTTPEDANEVADRAVADVELTLAPFGGKPALRNSWLNALVVALANRVFDFYFALDQATLEALPDTATDFLDRWAAIFGVSRTPGTQSEGSAIASGTVGATVPEGAILVDGAGKRYEARSTVAVSSKVLSVSSITRAGSVATLTTAVDHELGSQVLVTVSGANEVEYNVANAVATIVAADQIEYQVSGTPSSPATGTITLSFDSATIPARSEEYGDSEDQEFDAALRFESPLVGIDDVARVDFDGIGGGSERESDSALRERLLDRVQDPIAHFSEAEIVAVAKTVPGVTRVFVFAITPAVGQVTIYFMRDNDETPIPGGAEVSAVDDAIQAIRPANSDAADVIVAAPTPVPVDFTFTDLQPSTATMKAAVEASLEQFFSERTAVGEDVDEDAYRSAIFNTVDLETGDRVTTFALSAPSGDVAVSAGEIGTLGNVTFP